MYCILSAEPNFEGFVKAVITSNTCKEFKYTQSVLKGLAFMGRYTNLEKHYKLIEAYAFLKN